jgi:hypothetical protein
MADHLFGRVRVGPERATMPDMDAGFTSVEATLECLECGAESTETRGWKAFLDEELDLLVYCAACAEREFGE